jgi:phospholipid/cholesterol/gamma-HCH transport system permease protein
VRSALGWFQAWGRAARFAISVSAAALSRATYAPETRALALKQIYHSAWQVLIGYTLFAAVLSLVIIQITVSTARNYGLAPYALEMVFRVLVLELLPLGTALFVALRSGAELGAEIALMRAMGELDRLRADDIDPLKSEFVPRVVAAALSVFCLTVLSCGVAMLLAYFVMYGWSPWGFAEYTRDVALVFDLPALAGFALKAIAFGVAVAIIPIAAGMDATRDYHSAPGAVMGGMVRLVLALGVIQLLSLGVKYV